MSAARRALLAAYCAFVVWLPIETIGAFQGDGDTRVLSVSRLLGLLLLGVAVVDWRRCLGRIPAAFWAVAWYIAAYSLSQLWIPMEHDLLFLKKQLLLLYGAALFLVSANAFAEADLRIKVLRVYGWWVCLVAGGMMLGFFDGSAVNAEGRRTILGQDPNAAAWFFAAGALCLAADPRLYGPRPETGRVLAALGGVGVLIAGILQTGSRGGLIGFAAGAAGLAFSNRGAARGKKALVSGLVVAALGLLIMREFTHHTATAARIDEAWTKGDTSGRQQIYEEAWALFRERPLLGHGGALNVVKLGVNLRYSRGGYRDTHNLLLSVLTEVGLVGGAPFVLGLLLLLVRAWRHCRRGEDATPFALMCALLAVNVSITGTNQNLFWLTLAAAAACAGSPRPAPVPERA